MFVCVCVFTCVHIVCMFVCVCLCVSKFVSNQSLYFWNGFMKIIIMMSFAYP